MHRYTLNHILFQVRSRKMFELSFLHFYDWCFMSVQFGDRKLEKACGFYGANWRGNKVDFKELQSRRNETERTRIETKHVNSHPIQGMVSLLGMKVEGRVFLQNERSIIPEVTQNNFSWISWNLSKQMCIPDI